MTTNTNNVDSGRTQFLSEEILQNSVASYLVEGTAPANWTGEVFAVKDVTHFIKTTDGKFLAVCCEGDCHGMVVWEPLDTLQALTDRFNNEILIGLTGGKITKLT